MQTRKRQIPRFFASVEIVSNFNHKAVTRNSAFAHIPIHFSLIYSVGALSAASWAVAACAAEPL